MEIIPDRRPRVASFLVLAVAIVAITGLLAAGVFFLLYDAQQLQQTQKVSAATHPAPTAPALAGPPGHASHQVQYLIRLAWVCLVLLSLMLVLLGWIVARFFVSRVRPVSGPKHTPYVDAWKLAGERFKLPPDEASPDDDQ